MRLHSLPTSALALLLLAACGDDNVEADAGTDTGTDADAADTSAGDTTGDATEDAALDAADAADAAADTDSGEDANPGDADADTSEPLPNDWTTVPRAEAQADVDPNAWAPGDAIAPGEARLGVVVGQSPFSGPESRCRPGDYVLANSHLVACIASEISPNQYTYQGGYLVDIAPADHLEDERLEAILPGIELQGAGVDTIAAIRDGRDGGTAVLRVSGDDIPLAVIGNFIGLLPNSVPLRFETEYRLGPDATALEVVTWLNRRDEGTASRGITAGDLLISGDHVTGWAPGFGELSSLSRAESPLWYAIAPEMAYGIWSANQVITPFAPGLLESEIASTVLGRGRLSPTGEGAYTRYVAAARDVEGLNAAFADLMPLAADTVQVELAGPSGDGHPERRWVIETAEGEPVSVVRLDDAGAAAVQLPEGDFQARLWNVAAEAHPPTPFSVPSGAPVTLVAPDVGVLRVWVDTPQGESVVPSPAQIRVNGPVSRKDYALLGSGVLPLPPGTYTVEISRGEEFTHEVLSDVVVTAGGEANVTATLTRTMDTTGWVSGDFHQHSARSIDSSTQNIELVAANVGTGVDFIAPTDHDVIENYPRLVSELGLDEVLFTFNGTEISPIWGHVNAFPMAYDESAPRFGGVALSVPTEEGVQRFTGVELAAAAYEAGAEVLQINHPREGSAFFDSANYDPVLGPEAAKADIWFDGFTSMEVVNDLGYTCQVMRDWFSLLSRGIRVTGVGNSDSHSLNRAPGWPRNYLHVGHDLPAELRESMLIEAMQRQQVSVSGGLFLDFPDGELPGDTIEVPAGASEPASVRLRVQSPEWASASTIIMYVNGVETQRQTISVDDAELVDLDTIFELPADADNYVVFLAYNDTPMSAVIPGKRPFGFTNPLYIDVDADGWNAPGVFGPEDVPTPTLPFCR